MKTFLNHRIPKQRNFRYATEIFDYRFTSRFKFKFATSLSSQQNCFASRECTPILKTTSETKKYIMEFPKLLKFYQKRLKKQIKKRCFLVMQIEFGLYRFITIVLTYNRVCMFFTVKHKHSY